VNSGSSANLAVIQALKCLGRFKNKKIVVPALSWSTTVAPIIQLGFTPILCDADIKTLGPDLNHLEEIFKKEQPAAFLSVHLLGVPYHVNEVKRLCQKFGVILLEDSCESVGSTYSGKKTGTFGLASTFSLYFGHHISTIEGGIISTDDFELYEMLLMIRSHGWDRDVSQKTKERLRDKHKVSDFDALYTFYVPSFNIRATDLQAKIGLGQLDKLDDIVKKRMSNFYSYQEGIHNNHWKIDPGPLSEVSSLAYPIITPNRDAAIRSLRANDVEIRPLVCGSIGNQPFWKELYGKPNLKFAETVHSMGLYVPNNHQLTKEQINFICNIVNENV
jgi:CDP-6-deoxy-D-xylo-4-hexulose-3-dehydrase